MRDEYADVPDEVFKTARAQVLSALLGRSLFHTPAGRERWEETADATSPKRLPRSPAS